MTGWVALDIETTGLDPDRHEIWELALVDSTGRMVEYHLPVDLTRADPGALSVGRFYERRFGLLPGSGNNPASLSKYRHDGVGKWQPSALLGVEWHAADVARVLDGVHLVGVNPAFDAAFLSRWLRAHGQAPTWHYHLIDVGALALRWLHGRASGYMARKRSDVIGDVATLPWRSYPLSEACGVAPPTDAEKHTALGDALWASRWYRHLTGEVA